MLDFRCFLLTSSSLLTWPSIAIVKIGGNVSFSCGCSTESLICHGRKRWYHQPLWNNTEVLLYAGYSVQRFSNKFTVNIDNQTGRCDIIIKSVELTDAGQYKCKSSIDGSLASTSSLTVYGMNAVYQIMRSYFKRVYKLVKLQI